jgi:outer membrane protein assembly factor BamD (BamD/ComL family)
VTASAIPSARVETIDPSSLPIASASALPAPSAKSKTKLELAQDVEAERLLLETARVALRRGDREGALRLLQEHKNRFPQGQLREERDGLAVSALTLLGRTDEAAKAAARFRKDYPMSLQGAAMPETADAGR